MTSFLNLNLPDCAVLDMVGKFKCMKRNIDQYASSPETDDGTDAGAIILSYDRHKITGDKLFEVNFVDILIADKSESIQMAMEQAVKEEVDMIYIIYNPEYDHEYYTAYKNLFSKKKGINENSISFKKQKNDILIVSSFGDTNQRDSSLGFDTSVNEFKDIFTVGSANNHPTNFKISLKYGNEDKPNFIRGKFITKLVALIHQEEEKTFYCLNEFDSTLFKEFAFSNTLNGLIALIFCNEISLCEPLLHYAIYSRMKVAFIVSKKPLKFFNTFSDMAIPVAYLEPENYATLVKLRHTSRKLKFKISTSFDTMDHYNYYSPPLNNLRPGDALNLKPDVMSSSLHFSNKEDLINQLDRRKKGTVVSSARFAGMLLTLLNERLKNKKIIKRKEILARIQNTASPLLLGEYTLDNLDDPHAPGWAVSVMEQGAGLPNVQRAISNKVLIAPPTLELLPEIQSEARSLIIKNKGAEAVRYTVEHLPAVAIQVFPKVDKFKFIKEDKAMVLKFRLTTFTQCNSPPPNSKKKTTLDFKVSPRGKVTLCVYFEPNPSFKDPESNPFILSGYIRLVPKADTEDKEPLHVAYKYTTKKLELSKGSL